MAVNMVRPSPARPMRLDFASARYAIGARDTTNLSDLPEVALSSPGGFIRSPYGALHWVDAGSVPAIAGIAARVGDPASTNFCTVPNMAPVDTATWFVSNAALTLSVVSPSDMRDVVDSNGDYMFRAAIDAGKMNGKVFKLVNTSTTTAYRVDCPTADLDVSLRHSISLAMRCEAGSSGYAGVLNGGGYSDTYSGTGWAWVERTNILVPGSSLNLSIYAGPSSTIYFIAFQFEPLPFVTSPIAVVNAAVARAGTSLVVNTPITAPATIRVTAYMTANDGILRQLLRLTNTKGDVISVQRTPQQSLTVTCTGSDVIPRFPKVIGTGWFTFTLNLGRLALLSVQDYFNLVVRYQAVGMVLGFDGLLAHDEFTDIPGGLNSLTLLDSFGGWVSAIEILDNLTHEAHAQLCVMPAGGLTTDIRAYVSPAGDDANDGKSPAHPFKTGAPAQGVYQGTHIFYERGHQYPEMAQVPAACTIDAFGTGAMPQIGVGQATALDDNNVSGVRVQNVQLTGYTHTAVTIYGGTARVNRNWMLYQVTVGPVGAGAVDVNNAGISARFTQNTYIGKCTFTGGLGDHIYIEGHQKRCILEAPNFLEGPRGVHADMFQYAGTGDVHVLAPKGAWPIQTDSGKGGFAITSAGSVYVADGHLDLPGANYGVSINSSNQIVVRNYIRSSSRNSYSAPLYIGAGFDLSNVFWAHNTLAGGRRGVALTATATPSTFHRDNVTITHNLFIDCGLSPTTGQPAPGLSVAYFDSPASGVWGPQTYQNCGAPTRVVGNIAHLTGVTP